MRVSTWVEIKPYEEWSKDLKKKIETRLQATEACIYWDYDSGVRDETIIKALKSDPGNPMGAILSMIDDWGTSHDTEKEHIKDVLEHFLEDIKLELRLGNDDIIKVDDMVEELWDDLVDFVSVNYDLKKLLSSDINIRLEMCSNYDCINSHWFETQSGAAQCMDSYFGDCIRMLKLSPAKVKQMLTEKGINTSGKWPTKDDSKRLISYEDLWEEMENRSAPANLLTFVGKISQYELLNLDIKKAKLTIPKGNGCGFYSSGHGGGSPFDAKLIHNFELDLGKKYDKSGYLGFFLEIDDKSNRYSICDAYGVCQSFWGKEITIKEPTKTKKKNATV